MKLYKPRIILFVSLLILFLAPFNVSAASQEKKVEKQITKYLDAISKCDYKTVEKTMTKSARKNIIRHHKLFEKVIKRMHKDGFQYDIQDIEVSGKQATAIVEVEYYDAYLDFIYSFEYLLDDIRKNPKLSSKSDKIRKLWVDYLIERYEEAMGKCPEPADYTLEEDWEADFDFWEDDCYATKTIKIPLVKESGQWKISKHTKAMQNMMDCKMQEASKAIKKDKKKYARYLIFGF